MWRKVLLIAYSGVTLQHIQVISYHTEAGSTSIQIALL
jgi:hypothetical protein